MFVLVFRSSTAAKREAGKEGSRDENSGASSSKRDQDLPPRDRDRHRVSLSVWSLCACCYLAGMSFSVA